MPYLFQNVTKTECAKACIDYGGSYVTINNFVYLKGNTGIVYALKRVRIL